MAYKRCIAEAELAPNLHDIIGVSGQVTVFGRVIGGKVGPARTDMIEQNRPKAVFEYRCHVAPHILIAAKAMREHHRAFTSSRDMDIIAYASRHRASKAALCGLLIFDHTTQRGRVPIAGVRRGLLQASSKGPTPMPDPSSATFWSLVDRWQVSDEQALELISYEGKLPTTGLRP